MKTYDFLIIGAGVVGCCLASDLTRAGYKVCLVEKGSDVSVGASKANSGLIHAGFDAKENSLKAKLNVEGNKMFPSVCARLGVPLKRTGALVVGNDIEMVKKLYDRGIKNGVKNLEILEKDKLFSIVPNLNKNITCALYAKNAYIVNPYLLTICLCEEAIVNGADVLLDFDLKNAEKKQNLYEITSNYPSFFAKTIINSAGAGVNSVAKILKTETYPIEYRRGEYYVLDSTERVTSITIFPLPSAHSKGVVITPTIDGNTLVGPTSYISDSTTPTTLEGLNEIRERAQSILENINLKKAIRQFAGVRSIVGDDFVIEKSKKQENIINIAGICSPGLSSAPAISKFVLSLLNIEFKVVKNAQIKPYFLLKNLSDAQKSELISKNKSYSKIICKCENITEGDILFALDRPLKISSIDGIKRRVRAGMGRCQGGFCTLSTAEIIAKKRKIPIEQVIKENRNSQLMVGDIRGGNL